MTTLVVENLDGAKIATVVTTDKAGYEIATTDDSVRKLIEKILTEASEKGLVFYTYRRQKTDTGMRYQRLGRQLRPGASGFLLALGDYLMHYDLFAYPEEPTDE